MHIVSASMLLCRLCSRFVLVNRSSAGLVFDISSSLDTSGCLLTRKHGRQRWFFDTYFRYVKLAFLIE